MNRHFISLVLLNMLVNSLVYVPSILIRDRFDGAVMGILLATLLGSIMMAVFTFALKNHPNKGLPELLKRFPGWLKFAFLSAFGGIWFLAGAMTLLGINDIAQRYINPEMSEPRLIALFCTVIILSVAYLNTHKVLYLLEIILILNIPVLLIVLYLAYTGDNISWYSIFEVASRAGNIPSWSDLSAGSYVFAGYANMAIFQRVFPEKIRLSGLWPVPLMGCTVLLTVFFIPIAFHGTDGVGDLTFPWVTTVDSLRMELAPIERVTTIALINYIILSVVSIIVHWHISIELLRGSVSWRPRRVGIRNVFRWGVLLAFGVAVWLTENWMQELDILKFGEAWLNLRLPAEILLVAVLLILARRRTE
ncbi:hypothetical protein M0651_10920 [Paenibacillus sp. MBLB2552]|uniref:Uncharacterized protein n=1 Tax=Paenibacillus mellifer TaxID=2937794 RepID=A0A9X2BTA0_9BACL|nr:hypothetical protein [Paenibacillus mellifer]MCK8487686.1 hypothetical protein [Paenibacillus mellifer]